MTDAPQKDPEDLLMDELRRDVDAVLIRWINRDVSAALTVLGTCVADLINAVATSCDVDRFVLTDMTTQMIRECVQAGHEAKTPTVEAALRSMREGTN